jgi:hypothetical protein
MTNATTDQAPARDADYLVKDDQLKRAHQVTSYSESAFYGQHDRDEMEMIALELGIHLDDLRIVNKTTLRTAIFAQAEHNIEMGGKERAKVAAEIRVASWARDMLKAALKIEATIVTEAKLMVEKPFQTTDHWRLERLAQYHAEVEIRFGLVRVFFEMNDKKEWVRRIVADDHGNESKREVSLIDVHKSLQREVLQRARSGISRSTSQLSNLMDDMMNSCRAQIAEELTWLLRDAENHGIDLGGGDTELYI